MKIIHLSLVYRGLLCGVDVCWSSLDTYRPLMWLSVLLFQSEPCPGLVTLLVKMPPRSVFSMATFLCACTYVRVLCVGFCLLSVCVITRLYYIVHAYSAFPIPEPITIQFRPGDVATSYPGALSDTPLSVLPSVPPSHPWNKTPDTMQTMH